MWPLWPYQPEASGSWCPDSSSCSLKLGSTRCSSESWGLGITPSLPCWPCRRFACGIVWIPRLRGSGISVLRHAVRLAWMQIWICRGERAVLVFGSLVWWLLETCCFEVDLRSRREASVFISFLIDRLGCHTTAAWVLAVNQWCLWSAGWNHQSRCQFAWIV